MESKVQEAEMSVKALMSSILVGNSQIRLNNQQAEAITDKVMQNWQSIAQQWNKLQQSGQMVEINRERMEKPGTFAEDVPEKTDGGTPSEN